MAFKAVLFCASALLVQSISGQCIRRPSCGPSSSSCGRGSSGIGSSSIALPTSGGSLIVTSLGPIAPNGISVNSQANLSGDLKVDGQLPYLSAVSFDCNLPTSGSGSVNYGCGDGNVAITQEQGNPSGRNAASSSGLSAASLGCGCQ